MNAPHIERLTNPWWVLATLRGEFSPDNAPALEIARLTWNRYMATRLVETGKRDRLDQLREKRQFKELEPFGDQELQELRDKFAARASEVTQFQLQPTSFGDLNQLAGMPELPQIRINFRQFRFPSRFFADGWIFAGLAYFEGATFLRANFERAVFLDQASFTNVTFQKKWGNLEGVANFREVTFLGKVDFSKATFSPSAQFRNATFSDDADFRYATFHKAPDFINAEMLGPAKFDHATFASEPPMFQNAKLHEGTTWRWVTWPVRPNTRNQAEEFVESYARLKLEMDRLKKHEDELDFFACELQCRRILQGGWRGFPIDAYGALGDYGRSYVRPLLLLLAMVAVGAIPFWFYFGVGNATALFALPTFSHEFTVRNLLDAVTVRGSAFLTLIGGHLWDAIGFSFASTFGVLGLRNLIAVEKLPGWLKVVAAMQTTFGVGLLFLVSLGLRNRFRIK